MKDHSAIGFAGKLIIPLLLFSGVIGGGTLGYWLICGDAYPLKDYLYMTIITVSTVGYGEIIDTTANPGARYLTIGLIFSGMSVIVYFMSNVTAFIVEGDLKEIFWRRKMDKYIEGLSGHYIVCGVGRLGLHIINELHSTGRVAVAVDGQAETLNNIKEKFPSAGIVVGDAAENESLLRAGIARAAGLVAATGNDKDNLVVTFTARQMNPNIRIVARCDDVKHIEKMKNAGADSVVSANLIGGLRMASELIRPEVVSFLDMMLRDRDKALRIEEVRIPEGSALAGKNASEIKKKTLLLALRKSDGKYVYRPPDDAVLSPGTTVIFLGTKEERAEMESIARSRG